MANRDELKKALDYLRKKNPENPSLQKFDRTLRNYTGADKNSTLGSVTLFDHWDKNFNSATQSTRDAAGGRVQDLNGGWESKGYDKEMQKRKESPFDYVNSTAVKSIEKIKKDRLAAEKKKKSLVPSVKKPTMQTEPTKKKDKTLLGDLKDIGKLGYQTLNPFDKVSVADAADNYQRSKSSGAFKEIQRGSNRAVDSASFTAMSNFDKKMTGKTPEYLSKRKVGKGGVTDFATTGLGYLLPGAAQYKALNASRVGLGLTKFGSESIGKRLLSEAGKGAIVGAGLSVPEVAFKETLNPQDQNWKDNAKYIGMSTALGAVADPALYGAGKGIAKGFEKSSSSVMKGLLPKNEAVASEFSNAYKSFNAGPAVSKPTRFNLDELIPRGNDVTNPNFVPKLNPQVKPEVTVPKIGQTFDEMLASQKIEVPEIPQPSKSTKLDDIVKENWKRTANELEYLHGADVNTDASIHKVPMEVGKYYDAHGVSTGSVGKDLDGLINILDNGVDSTRAFHTAPLMGENLSGLGGASDGAFKNGSFILLGDKGQLIKDSGVKSVIVNDAYYGMINDLQKAYPDVHFVKANEAPKSLEVLANGKPIHQVEAPLNTNTPQRPSNVADMPSSAPQQPVARPENIPYVAGERKHYSTLANSEKAPGEFIDGIKNLDRKITNSLSDKDAADFANGLVGRDIEEAFQFVKNAEIRDKRHNVVGFRLLDEFNKSKQFERSVDMADILAKEGTKFGQGLQSFSVYNKLSAEGHLIRASRNLAKTNATLPAGKQIVLTPEIAHDIAASADSIQKLTGQQEIGNNVISLLENAKKGNRLTDEETKVVRSFMSDMKKFVGDLDTNAKPQKVKPIKDVRSRDKIVDFMSKQEEAAKKRIEARKSRANSLPVDIFYDYSVVGASKIAKGTVKFADFSEQMVKELGDKVKPYMQQIYNESVKNFNITSDRITSKRLTEAEKIVNKALANDSLSVSQADELLALTKQLVNAAGDSKFDAGMDLQVALNKLEQPTFAQMIASTHYQAMLLNPLTVVRNVVGNEVFYRIDRVSKLLAVPIDVARSKITGSNRTIVFNTGQFKWGNFFNPTKDFKKGMKIGTKAGWKGVNPLGLNTAYDIKSPAFSSNSQNLGLLKKALVSKFNPLKWTEKTLGVTMRSFDTAGYMRAHNQALREQATLKAMNEGLKGSTLREAAERYFREADENLMAIASDYGKYATFQDNTALARMLTGAKEGLNKLSSNAATLGTGKTKEFGLGSFIIPFPKTPANLIMRALEYSPAGIIRSVNLVKDYFKTGKNPLNLREAQMAFSRAIIGTGGLSGFGYILADKGVLTSAGNSDYEVRDLERMAGKQPSSVNTSAVGRFITNGFNLKDLTLEEGDTFVSYDWMQPLSIAISLGTGISQSYKESENPTTGDKILGAADSAANTIINMSSLSGINRMVSGPPNETWSEKIAGSLTSAGGSFVPTLSNQFRKLSDNTSRSTYAPTFGEKFQNAAINRIPGKQNLLPPSFNTLGKKKELYQDGTNNIFNIFANPSFVSKYKPSPEAKFVLDYINATGDNTVAPRVAVKKLDGIPLTGVQQSEMQRSMGEYVQSQLEMVVPQMEGSTNYEQIKKVLDKILENAGKKARGEIRAERGE
jgi:hypothetical protein